MKKNSLDILLKHQVPITDLRVKLIECLLHSKTPLCYDDFDIKCNKATFYRNMDLFIEKGVVIKSLMLDKGFYELNDTTKAHFVCNVCQKISNIKPPKLEQKNVSSIVLQGICDKCDN